MKSLALIVDDEPAIRDLLTITLERMAVEAIAVGSLSEARAALQQQRFDVCLTDMRLPDGDGLDLVSHIQASHPEVPVAVITAHGHMEAAVEALKRGAFDFVSKPVDLQVLRRLVTAALALRIRLPEPKAKLVGESAVMVRLRATLQKLARSQAPVFIGGESGTGKELVARLIHELGPRADRPFVPVNCGAIPAELIESELFGHRKGAFTGANQDSPGLFGAAQGGTLFLDEVADLPIGMQVKLLRALQEKSIRPVGATQEVAVDCRILSASHKPLADLVARGVFRQDLYYRIHVIAVGVPALRERMADLPLLVEHLLRRIATDYAMPPPSISAEALERLAAHAFPGNVRELENLLERAVALCEDQCIKAEDIELPMTGTDAAGSDLADTVEDVGGRGPLHPYLDGIERQRLLAALEATRWNRSAAARELGITLRALRYRLAKLGLS
jgi:two-component system, NtrC family, response regulator PilR